MKNEISPFSIAWRFWHSQLDKNTIVFAPRDENTAVDFLNYFLDLEEPRHSILEYWEDGCYILNCILLTKDEENNWHLKIGLHGYPFVEFDMPQMQELRDAFLNECWDSYFEEGKSSL